tara:strand:+ start:31 stop:300 length:270 start_codon:yes stop_codon:yes gene_type:complete
MIIETYQTALQNLDKKIPDDYHLKNILKEKIAYTIHHLYHKAPEIISMEFSNTCCKLIEYLPKKEMVKQNLVMNGLMKVGNLLQMLQRR